MGQLCLARCDFEDEACSTLFFFYSLCLLAGGGGGGIGLSSRKSLRLDSVIFLWQRLS